MHRGLAALIPRVNDYRQKNSGLLLNNAIYLGGSVVVGLLGYVFHFVVGRMLGPASYGIVAASLAALYLLTLPALIVQIVSARFTSLAAGRNELGGVRTMVMQISALSLVVGLPVVIGLIVFAPQASQYLQVPDNRVVYVLAATTLVTLLVAANRGALQGLRRFMTLAGNQAIDMGSRVLLGGALVAAGLHALGAVIALLLGPLLAYVQSIVLMFRLKGDPARERTPLANVGRYAISAAIAAMGVTYLFNADVVLAKHYLSSTDAGIYAAGSVLGRVAYFLGVTVASVMFPEVATLHARDENHFHVVDASLLLMLALSAALIAGYFLVPQLVLLPYGSGFAPVRPYLGPFAIALSLLAISNLMVNYFLSVNSQRFVAPLIGASVLETILIVLFHSGIGQILAMLATAIGVLAVALGTLYAAERFRPARSRELVDGLPSVVGDSPAQPGEVALEARPPPP
jgi:O-antigen/teichoic acid export membrane protein